MLKKLLTAAAASAFSLTLYVAPASACPGADNSVVTKKQKKDQDATKKAEKKTDSEKKKNKAEKAPKKKA